MTLSVMDLCTLAFILLFNEFEIFPQMTLKFSSASSSNNVHSAGEKNYFCSRLITAVDTDMVRNFITFLKRFMNTYSSCIAARSNELSMDSYPTDSYPPCYSYFVQCILIQWIEDLSGGYPGVWIAQALKTVYVLPFRAFLFLLKW